MENNYFKAKPKFYEKDNVILGVFALTEGVKTVMPETPLYEVDGRKDISWKIFLVSTTMQAPLGVVPYEEALYFIKKIKGTQVKNGQVYIPSLELEKMEELLDQCRH